MKNILLVDNEATVLEIYKQQFVREGFAVETAADGPAAARLFCEVKPDLVVLDFMMPGQTGAEVLKFIRSQPVRQSTPIVILTNAFMCGWGEAATGQGVQRTVCRGDCTAARLVSMANEVLSGGPVPSAPLPPLPPPPAGAATAASGETNLRVRRQLLGHAPETVAALRTLYQELTQCSDTAAALPKLASLYRTAHFVVSVAGLAECHRIAHLSSGLEALLFELQERPAHLDPSVLRTIGMTVDFLEVLFDHSHERSVEDRITGRVLVVDDDPLSNHLAVAALRRARLDARAADNPLIGLELLRQTAYDLVLLDIEMPHMTGFDLCRKLRTLPGYARTPVIYVTAHSDFESRATGVLAGGDDLIAKPVFPIELTVKSVMHLIKSRLPSAGDA